MGMPEVVERWTREMVLALPDDGNRYELVDGELLVTPAPAMRHQHAVMLLAECISPYVKANGLGQLLLSPADLSLGGKHLMQPDLFVLRGLPPDRRWEHVQNPILVIEVLSPSSGRADRLVKRRRYQRSGIPEYWVVDLEARIVERWRPDDQRPEILDEQVTWKPEGAGEPLVIPLAGFFAEIWGEP